MDAEGRAVIARLRRPLLVVALGLGPIAAGLAIGGRVEAALAVLALGQMLGLGFLVDLRRGHARTMSRHQRQTSEELEQSLSRLAHQLDGLTRRLGMYRSDVALQHADARQALEARADHLEAAVGRTTERTGERLTRIGKDITSLSDQVGQVQDRVQAVKRDLGGVVREIGGGVERLQRSQRRRAAEITKVVETSWAQMEALLNLHRLTAVPQAMPPTRGWALGPDSLLFVASVMIERRVRTVVECGSGASSIWLGRILRDHGQGRVVSLEHDAQYAEHVRTYVRKHGLAGVVDVRDAPFMQHEIAGEAWTWYAADAITDLDACEVLLVDGPPKGTAHMARYPALPLMAPRLAPRATVVLDDSNREDERKIIERWISEFPEFTMSELPHEKGTVVLERAGET